jgi:acetyl-CoA carboxylase biotin carboxyl carrier protein
METRVMQEVLDWMRTTDLAELAYRRGAGGMELRLEGAAPAQAAAFPPCSLIPVTSPEVGLFRWNQAGAPRRVDKGSLVAEGALLGLVEVGSRKVELKASASGKVVSVLIDDGKAVEYGQPLFFIKPE